MAYVLIPCSEASAAATASLVERGLEPHKATSAPPALRVSIRFAVSLVTCRQAATLSPLSGSCFSKRARIRVRTGISRAAQSMRSCPWGARLRSFTSLPLVLTFKSGVLSLVHDLTDDFDVGEALSPAQVFELDQDLDSDHLTSELANQANRGGCGAARGQYIIDDQDLLAGFDGIRMDLELVGSVLELVRLADGFPGQLAHLADGYETGVELDGDRRARDETARLDGGHEVGCRLGPPLRHHVDDLAKYLLAGGQRRDVAKNDAGLREAGDVANVLLQLLRRGHTTDRKYSRVRLRPSSRGTSGSQPSRLRARVMSGRRCFGSSIGRGRWTIPLFEPARRMIVSASSSTVTSLGLPRLTGISSPRSSTRSTPRTRSET